jgi:DNA-binding CsgD family transcriptional regulator
MSDTFFIILAKAMLAQFGITSASPQQLKRMRKLLSNAYVNCHILIDSKLSKTESRCLLLAAQGNTSDESAKILNISKTTVETHRKEIKRKLGCSSIAHAVYQGIRYGYVRTKS